MGACTFYKTCEAETARKAFEELTGDAAYEYGHGRYNGTISTCSMGRCVKTFAEYNKDNVIIADKIIKDLGCGSKWKADYIDLGVAYYIVREVKKTNKTYNAKYKQRFVVCDGDTQLPLRSEKSYETKPEADKRAIELALEGKDVCVRKTMVKLSGNDVVSLFEFTEKRTEKKPKLKAQDTRTVVPVHKYIFFGWAAE